MTSLLLRLATLMVTVAAADAAFAHEAGAGSGFVSGLTHPLFGLDHVVAMVAVGLWGGQLKQPAIWLLPVTFPVVMAFGGMLGARGVPLPAVETGIAASAIVLGILVFRAATPPLWVAAVIVGIFAVFHGHAHGTELPDSATPIAYGSGFVISTGLLHAAGILLGTLVKWSSGRKVVKCCGAVISAIGVYFLIGSLSS